jgi:hypothetical protein
MKRALLTITFLYLATGISFGQIDLNKVVNRSAKKAERNVENRLNAASTMGLTNRLMLLKMALITV